eukprot:TCALIF_07069-PA protein Name:"Similar to AAAS Aladin (Homo sapiens)" AED:0.21 eAED:0.22 QI:0/0/0/0.66/0.8/0.83/6/0/393
MNPGGGSSLLEFPLPLAGASHGFCCEYDATLRSDASGGGGFEGPPGAGPLWACLRVLTVSADSAEPLSVGAGSLNEPSGLLSAKNAFLPPRQERQLQMRRALSTWLDEGFFSALESLASTSEGRFTTCWARGLEGVARALLATYRMTSNIHSSFNPHLMLSGEDMIARFSPNRDWFGSKIRVMAWHPHTLKLAVAFKTDQIQVLGQDLLASPTLKYKRQRGVACLAWRPLNGSELAVGCLTGLLIWTVDPLSVAARPSASCVNFLPTPPGHAPVTSLNWDPQEPLIYCLNFHPVGGSSAAAVPVADMSQIKIDVNGEVINIGGPIQSMKWNSMGERLAVSFKNSDCIALYCTTLYPTLGLSPIGLIQGLEGESPMTMEFAHKCDHGAILSVMP